MTLFNWSRRSDKSSRRAKRNRPRYRRLPVEQLEERALLAAVHLIVTGTSAADEITIDHSGLTTTVIKNGVPTNYADSDLLSISIQPFGGNDVVRINHNPDVPTSVYAGDGDDQIHLGDGYFYGLSNLIDVHGQDGNDTVYVHDQSSTGDTRPYQIGSNLFTRLYDVTIVSFDAVENVDVDANAEGTDFQVDIVDPGVHVSITDHGGSDTLKVGSVFGSMDEIQGTVHFDGGAFDHAVLDDHLGATGQNYVVSSTSSGAATLERGSALIEVSGTPSIGLVTTAFDDAIDVRSTPANVAWSFDDTAGSDQLALTPSLLIPGPFPTISGGRLETIQGPIAFGGNGGDTIVLDDRYSYDGRTYRFEPGDNDNYELDFGGPELLYYQNVDTITVRAGHDDDQFVARESGTALHLDGGDGSNYYEFTANGNGPVFVTGSGMDFIDIDGSPDIGPAGSGVLPPVGSYRYDTIVDSDGLETGRFYRGLGALTLTSPISYRNVESLFYDGRSIGYRHDVSSTLPGTTITILGSDGLYDVDYFSVNAEGLRSDVTVHGRRPDSPPGDSLTVFGNGSTDGVNAPDPHSSSDGTFTVNGHTIRYTGLEPVTASNFHRVTHVTPLSSDDVHVRRDGDDLLVEGSSTNIGLSPVDWEVLRVRNTAEVVVDAATNDFLVYEPGTVYFPNPNDQVVIESGARSTPGLESLRVFTGAGVNDVEDKTFTGVTTASAHFFVDGSGGSTRVFVSGAATRADIEQFSGRQASFTAYDSEGNVVSSGGFFFIELLDMLTGWDYVRAIGEDVDRTFSGTTRQTIAGDGLTTVNVTPGLTDSQLDIVALGTSRVELHGVPFAERTISGWRDAGPQPEPPVRLDNVTVRYTDVFAAGPQPEPPLMRVVGYGTEDQFTVAGATMLDGTPVPSDFALTFDDSDNEKIELLGVGFNVETGVMGAGPALGFVGDASVENCVHVDRSVAIDPGMIQPLPINLFNVDCVEINGSTDPEGLSISTQAGGGVQMASVNLNDVGRDIYFTADEHLLKIQSDGGGGPDRLDVQYTEPDFRNLTTDLQEFETVNLTAANSIELLEPVRQTLTPTSGSLRAGNLLVTHDDSLTSSFVEAHDIESFVTADSVSDTFYRDLSLNYAYLGSEGKHVVENVKFAGKVERTFLHKDGATNTTTIQEKDDVYEQKAITKIVGAEGGEDQVLVTKSGVETKDGSTLEVDSKSGDAFVIVTESDSGSAAGTQDEILVKGSGDPDSTTAVKKVRVHKQQDAKPIEQLDDLTLEKPEDAAKIDALKAKADQRLLSEKGAAKANAGETKVDYKGEATKLDLFLKNVDAKAVEATVENPDGTTNVEKVGNVVVDVPDLEGTGVDPAQPFKTFVVTNTFDSGDGSLRDALEAANTWTGDGLAVITFAIPDTDSNYVDVDSQFGGDNDPEVFVISPLTALPALTRDSIVINGQSQQNLTGDTNPLGPEIVLAGNLAGANANGLVLTSSNNVIHGLNIQQFSGDGVLITSNTPPQAAEPIFDVGPLIGIPGEMPPPDNSVTGNNIVSGNYIGADATGTAAAGNGGQGVHILNASGNLVGGTTDLARNVISGNNGEGIKVIGEFTDGNVIRGNYVGLNAVGTAAIGNQLSGIFVPGATNTQIVDNVVSGNLGFAGIAICGSGICGGAASSGDTSGTLIQGNLVGTNAAGDEAVANLGYGISIDGGTGRTVGGTTDEARNVISGNGSNGLYFFNEAQGDTVQGNYIGAAADGTTALGNGASGIHINNGSDIVIGGIDPGAGNVIAFNAQQGVSITGDGSTGNTVRGNSIHSNGGIGIDLGGDGVTENDLGDPNVDPPVQPDADSGPNQLQNFPVLSTARTAQPGTRVAGRIHSSPGTVLVIDFYASPAADVEGFREGARWIGSTSVVTNELGDAGFSAVVGDAELGEIVTATATDPQGNTSEFSAAVEVRGPGSGGGGNGNGGGPALALATSSVETAASPDAQTSPADALLLMGSVDASMPNVGTNDVSSVQLPNVWNSGASPLSVLVDEALTPLAVDPARHATASVAEDDSAQAAYVSAVDEFFSELDNLLVDTTSTGF